MNHLPNELKKTSARIALLETFKTLNHPVSVSELYKAQPEIPIATLYRVIDAFVAHGLIEISDEFQPKEKHYVLKTEHTHHSIKCVVCNKTMILSECPIHLDENIEGYKIIRHRLEIEGICQKCQRQHSTQVNQ